MTADTRKLIAVMGTIVGLITLTITGKADANQTIPTITALVGYVVGNGKNAVQGNTSQPMIKPKDPQDTKESQSNG